MRTPFVLALLWCSLAFADRLVPELDAGRFGMLERELQLNREQTGMLRAARLAYVSELDLIREQRSAALSAAARLGRSWLAARALTIAASRTPSWT